MSSVRMRMMLGGRSAGGPSADAGSLAQFVGTFSGWVQGLPDLRRVPDEKPDGFARATAPATTSTTTIRSAVLIRESPFHWITRVAPASASRESTSRKWTSGMDIQGTRHLYQCETLFKSS